MLVRRTSQDPLAGSRRKTSLLKPPAPSWPLSLGETSPPKTTTLPLGSAKLAHTLRSDTISGLSCTTHSRSAML